MNNVLELTVKETGLKFCVPIQKIMSVVERPDGTCFIETVVNERGNSYGFNTVELYKDVAKLILFAS